MSKKLSDYLTKQVFIEKNVVTFRSLSRHCNIHVNIAKKELATFHESSRSSHERAYATHLITGEAFAKQSKSIHGASIQGGSMDVDSEEAQELEEEDAEVVPEVRITLAGEQDLDAARANYSRIYSEHIYSLSPSPVLDVGLLCGPSDVVYATDATVSPSESTLLGRITGPHVEFGKPSKPIASTSNVRERMMKPVAVAKAAPEKAESQPAPLAKGVATKGAEEKVTPPKAKATGKLDFSKAKSKVKTEESQAQIKVEEAEPMPETRAQRLDKTSGGKASAPTVKDFFGKKDANKSKEPVPAQSKKEVKSEKSQANLLAEPAAKRGVKRKSALPVDTDTEPEPAPSPRERSATPQKGSQPSYKIRGNAILSDEDDEDEPMPTVKRKGKPKAPIDMDLDDVPSRSERSLRTIMDIDDERVEKVSRLRIAQSDAATSEEEAVDEDVMMDDESDVPAEKPKRKKREKKAVPVGRNGLQKKRIVKSRMTTDEKGYMVTEDYSEYESVDEEEADEPAPKAKKAAKATTSSNAVAKSTVAKKETAAEKEPRRTIKAPPLKKSASSGAKVTQKGSLMNFFGKK